MDHGEHGDALKILLVDDDRLLLAAFSRLLTLKRPHWEIATANDGAEAMHILKGTPVGILVTDIQMPGIGGMALLGLVREDPALASLPLILMTAHSDTATMRRGMSSGADDFLTKPFTPDELVQAIEGRLRRLALGAAEATREAPALAKELKEKLTERELEVLIQIGRGLVTKDIAERLDLSPRTVSVHRANIMRKLDLHNAAALAALAIRAGV